MAVRASLKEIPIIPIIIHQLLSWKEIPIIIHNGWYVILIIKVL